MKKHIIPKTIKAIAIISHDERTFDPLDVYRLKDSESICLNSGEIKCEVEIVFKKFIK